MQIGFTSMNTHSLVLQQIVNKRFYMTIKCYQMNELNVLNGGNYLQFNGNWGRQTIDF